MDITEVREYINRGVEDRADTITYLDRFLARQRHVNEMVFRYIQDLLPPNSFIVDPCAGPEGSMVAALARDFHWAGNDVSLEFSKNRAGTPKTMHVLSDFHKSPFVSEIADATVFVYALNNLDTVSGLCEAQRITKPSGLIVSASPGPGVWISDIVGMSMAGDIFSEYFQKDIFTETIPAHFAQLPYTQEEYVDYYLHYKIGTTRDELKQAYTDLFSSQPRKRQVPFEMQNIISAYYFQHVSDVAESIGLTVERLGILALSKNLKTQSWSVQPVLPVSSMDELHEQFFELRHSRGKLHDSLPEHMKHGSASMVVPVHVFRKNLTNKSPV